MKKKGIRRKVISVITAASILAGMGTMTVSARYAQTKNGYTYYSDLNSTYVDKYGNIIYNGQGYLMTPSKERLYEKSNYYFDADGNAVIFNYPKSNVNNNYNSFTNSYGGFTTEDNYPNYYYNQNYYDSNYYDSNYYYNPNEHINVDISDPQVYQRYLNAHKANCTDQNCIVNNHNNYMSQFYTDNNPNYTDSYDYNNYPNNWNQQNDYNNYNNANGYYNNQNIYQEPVYEVRKLYTLLKYDKYGNKVYAYAADTDVSKYGFSGWVLNSEYNANDYALNSVFYEEKHHFGNNYDWNAELVEFIKQTSGLYIWMYQNNLGETKYCISPIKDPNTSAFVYNSPFDPKNDVISELKTADAVYNQGYVRTYHY